MISLIIVNGSQHKDVPIKPCAKVIWTDYETPFLAIKRRGFAFISGGIGDDRNLMQIIVGANLSARRDFYGKDYE